MKTKKAIFGLILSVSMLVGMNSMQKATQANIGWGVSALFDADNNTTSTNVVGGTAAGAVEGAEIGLWGGIVGVAVGAVVGGL